jgi:hypothetical protein
MMGSAPFRSLPLPSAPFPGADHSPFRSLFPYTPVGGGERERKGWEPKGPFFQGVPLPSVPVCKETRV